MASRDWGTMECLGSPAQVRRSDANRDWCEYMKPKFFKLRFIFQIKTNRKKRKTKCKLYLSSLRPSFLAGSMDAASKSAFIARQAQWASHGGSRVKLCPNCQLHPLTDTRVFGRSRCYPPVAAVVTDRLSDRTTREMWSASSPAPSCWPRSLAEILGMTLRSMSSSAKHVRRWREEHGMHMNRLESKITCDYQLDGEFKEQRLVHDSQDSSRVKGQVSAVLDLFPSCSARVTCSVSW